METKFFSSAEIFFVITGHLIPDTVLPKVFKGFNKKNILEFLLEEQIDENLIEEVRHECKFYLLQQFNFLLSWDLGEDVWNSDRAIQYFFLKYCTNHLYFEIRPMLHKERKTFQEWSCIKKGIQGNCTV